MGYHWPAQQLVGFSLADSKKRITNNRATQRLRLIRTNHSSDFAVKLERRWSSRFHFKLRTNTWKLPMWKVEAYIGPGKQQERSKTYRDAMLCSISVDNTRNQNKLTFKLQFLGIKAKFDIGSIKEENSPPKQFVTSQQL